MDKILIVEDEEKLREELKLFLTKNGYDVLTISNFTNTLEDILKIDVSLILLDINLPGVNGEYLLHEIRKSIQTPIIMLTSKNNELDELLSINYGADDYITKPYNIQILLARINRILKRQIFSITYKDLILDINKSSLIKDNKVVDLSRNEFKTFYYLVSNKGRIITRDELMNYLWDNNEFIDDNTLTVNINRLRNKLETLGYKDIIITKRSQGYIVL